jgi:hypothetical protein
VTAAVEVALVIYVVIRIIHADEPNRARPVLADDIAGEPDVYRLARVRLDIRLE